MGLQVLLFIILASSSINDADGLRINLFGAEPGESAFMPIRGFLTLPPGQVHEPGGLGVFDSTGAACHADLDVTARHPDGSVRFLAIRTFLESRKARPWLQLRNRKGDFPCTEPIVCRNREKGALLEVDTGSLRAAFSTKGENWVEGFWLHGEPMLASEASLIMKVLLNHKSFRSVSPRMITVDEGNAALRVRIRSRTRSRCSSMGPDCEMRFSFFPNSTLIQCEAKVLGTGISGDGGYSDGIFVQIKPSMLTSKSRVFLLGENPGSRSRAVACTLPVSLEAGNCGLRCREQGRSAPFPKTENAGLFLRGDDGGLGVYFPQFRQLHPWSVGCNPVDGIEISLFSDSFLWEKGFSCERRFLIEASADRAMPEPPPKQGALSGVTSFGLSEEKACRTFPFASPCDDSIKDPGFRLLKKATQSLVNGLEAEKKLWDGYRDSGDYRMEYGQFANCEFDPAYGYLKRFLLFGQFDDLIRAEATLKHWLLFDRVGASDARALPGLPWMHGDDHASGDIELGHMWIDGALLYYQMTNDPECREAALCVGKYMADRILDDDAPILERCVSWSLMALTALVDAGFSEFNEAMDRYAALLCKRQAGEGYFRFDRVHDEGIEWYSCSPWITGGITLEALYRHYALTKDLASKHALQKGARWLVTEAWNRRKGEWHSRVLYGRDAKGKRVMKTSSRYVHTEDLPLVALGLARAGKVASDKKLLKKARKALLKGLRQVDSIEHEYPGRAFALVMRAAPDVLLATRGVGN